jgi:hypothetical protein
MARRIQECYDNGYSPAIYNTLGIGASNARTPTASPSSRFGYRQYPLAVRTDELSSDGSDGLVPFGDDGDFIDEAFPTVKAELDYDPSTSNWPLLNPPQQDLGFLDWIDMPVGREGTDISPFNSHPSAFVKEEDVPSMNLPNPHQIVDPTGNVLLNGGWGVPGGFGRLSGEVRNYVDYVFNDPTKTLDEIKSLLENIRPDMEIPKEKREGTPEAMYYPLMEHQKVGLTWLKKMEEGTAKGGILADDMGLGKTIQTLALLVARPSQDEKRKTTLIVAPVALLKQWEREINKKLKADHQLSVYIYHGPGKKAKSFADLAKYDGRI